MGAAVGIILYAGAEIARRILKAAPKDDPVVKEIQKDLKAAHSQIEFLSLENYAIIKRLQKIERNGKK